MLNVVSDILQILKNTSKRFKVMRVRMNLRNFMENVNPYNSIYVKVLGATETQIGVLTAISSGFGAVSVGSSVPDATMPSGNARYFCQSLPVRMPSSE